MDRYNINGSTVTKCIGVYLHICSLSHNPPVSISSVSSTVPYFDVYTFISDPQTHCYIYTSVKTALIRVMLYVHQACTLKFNPTTEQPNPLLTNLNVTCVNIHPCSIALKKITVCGLNRVKCF